MSIERRSGIGGPLVAGPAATGGRPTALSGYAARFNSPATIGGLFEERIAPGAFRAAAGAGNTVALFNHDSARVLGRQSNNTLVLREDAKGLYFTIHPPDTQDGRDVLTLVKRGDVAGCSFAFTVEKDRWSFPSGPDALPRREILKVGSLLDVGPVTYPAYPSTNVEAKAATRRRS